jgi:hypothetical protein
MTHVDVRRASKAAPAWLAVVATAACCCAARQARTSRELCETRIVDDDAVLERWWNSDSDAPSCGSECSSARVDIVSYPREVSAVDYAEGKVMITTRLTNTGYRNVWVSHEDELGYVAWIGDGQGKELGITVTNHPPRSTCDHYGLLAPGAYVDVPFWLGYRAAPADGIVRVRVAYFSAFQDGSGSARPN